MAQCIPQAISLTSESLCSPQAEGLLLVLNITPQFLKKMPVCVRAQGGQKSVSYLLELELQVDVNHPVWVLGT